MKLKQILEKYPYFECFRYILIKKLVHIASIIIDATIHTL